MSPRRRLLALAAAGLATATTFALTPAAGQASQIRIDRITHARYVTALTGPPSVSRSPHWKLVFVDNFTKPLNQTSAWSIYTNPDIMGGTNYFNASHVTRTAADGGQLHIKGYVDKAVKGSDGRVVTGGLGLWERPQKYGKYNALVRINSCSQVKYAWLLWPYNNVWPKDGEIDFAEDEGGNRTLTTASLNYAAKNGSRATLPQDYASPKRSLSGWHLIGVEWTPTSVRYTMDGQYWGSTKTTHIPQTPMVFVMQTQGMTQPGHNTLEGQCNADIGWVAQYAYTGH